MKGFDAALLAAAIGLSAFTTYLCGADYPAEFALAEPDALAGLAPDDGLRAIVLHDAADASRCRYELAGRSVRARPRPGSDPLDRVTIGIALDAPDEAALVALLARICRMTRIAPERIYAHREVSRRGACRLTLDRAALAAAVKREMLR